MAATSGDVRPHRFFLRLNPPSRDQNCSFTGRFVVNLPQILQNKKKREGHSAEMQNKKKHEKTSVKSTKTHHLRIQMLAELSTVIVLKLHCHLKKINDPTPPRSAVPFFASCRTKKISIKIWVISLVFSYSIGQTRPVEEVGWSRNSAFFRRKTKPQRASPAGGPLATQVS